MDTTIEVGAIYINKQDGHEVEVLAYAEGTVLYCSVRRRHDTYHALSTGFFENTHR